MGVIGMDSNIRRMPTPGTCDAEWQVRTDLAALHRLYVRFGWTDLIYTHLTARSPDNHDHYFIKPDDFLMEEVTASCLVKMDMDGNLIAGDYRPNQAGHLIHTAVLKSRPEINFSAHTHSRAGAAVSCMTCGLLPLSQHANTILPTVATHDYQYITRAEDECEILARDLGDKFCLIMNNHGLLTCGRSISECFHYLYYLEMACKIQVDVLASGREPILVAEKIVDDLFGDGGAPENEPVGADRVWEAMIRTLDRTDEGYRY